MTARAYIPVSTKIDVALRQCGYCPLCGQLLMPGQKRVLEHLVPRATRLALGLDPDAPEILAWVHKACADLKTNGKQATCADGDIHKIAKAKRLHAKHFGTQKPKRKTLSGGQPLRGRAFPKCSRKIQSRPFQKREDLRA